MGLPFSTSTVDVARPVVTTTTQDGYDPVEDLPDPANEVVATGVSAVIDPPTASANVSTGFRDVFSSALRCDPIPTLQADDLVTDHATGIIWRVLWAIQVNAVGLQFTSAGLRMVTGFAQ